MFEKYGMKRNGIILSGASIALLWVQSAASAPPAARSPGVCTTSYKQAQEHRKAGQLRKALEALSACVQTSCGASVSKQCGSDRQLVENDLPTVVPVVTSAAGDPLLDVSVAVDGELLASRIDGRALAVDPGPHEFVFSTGGEAVHSEKLLILQGQRNRVLSVRLAAAAAAGAPAGAKPEVVALAAAPTPEERSKDAASAETKPDAPPSAATEAAQGPSLFPLILGGAGVAAIGGAFLFAHWGNKDNEALDQCAPNCSQDSVDHVHNMYVAADVSLGVGLVALGTATWLFVSELGSERPVETAQTYHFDVRPTASGGFATIRGAF